MMSDIEEPPTKVTKIELAVAEASDDPIEGIEHSQEEWLSEGVLTDDDYNQTMEQDGTFSNIGNTSQDESTMQSTNFDSLENTDNPEIDPQEYGVQGELKAESLQMDSQDATGNLHIDYQESVGNVQIEFQDNGQNVKVEYKARENAKIGTHGNAEITETEEQAMLNTVEETLNNFENERTLETMVQVDNSETLTEDLSMYLIKKNEVKKEEQKYREDKQDVEKDDGNDTDELLRMLGEGGCGDSKKKMLKTVKKSVLASQEDSTDDEENIFKNATKIATMKVARNAQIFRKQAPKMAAPESDSDMASDEEQTMRKMFRVKPPQAQPVRTLRSMNKNDTGNNQHSLLKSNHKPSNASTPSVLSTNANSATKTSPTSTPLRTYTNTRLHKKQSLPTLKEAAKPATPTPEVRKPEVRKMEVRKIEMRAVEVRKPEMRKLEVKKPEMRKVEVNKPEMRKVEVKKPEMRKVVVNKPEMRKVEVNKPEMRKIEVKKPEVTKTLTQQIKYVEEEESLMDDDEDYDMDEELEDDEELSRLKRKAAKQQLMKPEQMDEDMLSDEDSEPSDDSFYDEMPSSESEDIEEWFALDIRAERAGDYIPLLGHKANELLAEEKKRVAKKLSVLRENIQALAQKSKEQTDQIEAARRSLAELDTILTHT